MVEKKKVAFIFPGQGAQYVGMGKDLYENFSEAKEIFDKANDIAGFDLKGLCFDGPKDKLSTTNFSQPAILVTSIASLACLKTSLPDINVKAALGLSLGEYTALVSAGAIKFEDALKLVKARGQFMEEASKENPGKMASIIGLDKNIVEDICKEAGCDIANLNCPGQVVVSGKSNTIEECARLAKEKGAKRSIILEVSGPFHSSLMKSARDKLETVLDGIDIKEPIIPVISNVDASHETSPVVIKKNLLTQLVSRTYWENSIRLLIKEGVRDFLEIGPGKVLRGLLRRIDANVTVYNAGTKEEIDNIADSLSPREG